MKSYSEEDQKQILEEFIRIRKIFKENLKMEPVGATLNMLQYIDSKVANKFLQDTISCKKGCSFCCHNPIDSTELEAKVIAQYCQENHITINRKHLAQQLALSVQEVPYSRFSACVFLKNNLCTIYPVRPANCRKYFVSSDPSLCNTRKYGSQRVTIVANTESEICNTVLIETQGKWDRLPRLLLPYSQ